MFGRNHTEETRRKMRRVLTEETKAKMSKSRKLYFERIALEKESTKIRQ